MTVLWMLSGALAVMCLLALTPSGPPGLPTALLPLGAVALLTLLLRRRRPPS